MAQWIEVRARYDKMMENGVVKKVTEPYLVDALSCTEDAYDNFIDGMRGTMADYEIEAITETKIVEVYPANLSNDNG